MENMFSKCNCRGLKCKICTLEDKTIINIISNDSGVKQEDFANMINKSLRTVKMRMNEMQGKGGDC